METDERFVVVEIIHASKHTLICWGCFDQWMHNLERVFYDLKDAKTYAENRNRETERDFQTGG